MIITIKIDTENEAFTETGDAEIARILRSAAQTVEDYGPIEQTLMDSNGNAVGAFTTDPEA